MVVILLLVIEVVFVLVAFQDFRTRSVHWFLFPIAYVLCLYHSSLFLPFEELSMYVGLNTGILILLILVLLFYLVLRHGKEGLKLGSFLGAGDVLFFFIISTCFSPFNFIIFCLISFSITLLVSMLCLSNKRSVALAGWQALALGLALFFQHLSIIHLFNENWIFKLI